MVATGETTQAYRHWNKVEAAQAPPFKAAAAATAVFVVVAASMVLLVLPLKDCVLFVMQMPLIRSSGPSCRWIPCESQLGRAAVGPGAVQ